MKTKVVPVVVCLCAALLAVARPGSSKSEPSASQPTQIAIPAPEPSATYQQAEDWFVQNSKEHHLTVFGNAQITVDGKGIVAVDDQKVELNGYLTVFPKKTCEIKIVGSIDIRIWQDKAKVVFSEDAYLESDGHASISLAESKPAIALGQSAHYKAVKLQELVVHTTRPVKLYALHCGKVSVEGYAAQIFVDHCKEVDAQWNARVEAHYCTNVKAVDNVNLAHSHCQNVQADKTCIVTQK